MDYISENIIVSPLFSIPEDHELVAVHKRTTQTAFNVHLMAQNCYLVPDRYVVTEKVEVYFKEGKEK